MRNILAVTAATLFLSTAAFAQENGIKDMPDATPPKAELDTPPKADLATPPKPEPVHTPGYREASWRGGHGSTWKTGWRSYGFEGFYGGCHYFGHAGPHGYHLDKEC